MKALGARPSIEELRSVAVRYAAWLLDRVGEQELHFTVLRGTCSTCGRLNERGLWIHCGAGAIRCPSCAPTTRRCTRCRQVRPVDEFQVAVRRMIVEPYCQSCRRARGREQYHRAQASARVPAPSRTCTKCGREFTVREGYVDRRYRTRINPVCRRCAGSR